MKSVQLIKYFHNMWCKIQWNHILSNKKKKNKFYLCQINNKLCQPIINNNVVRHLRVILSKILFQEGIKRKCMRHLISEMIGVEVNLFRIQQMIILVMRGQMYLV